MPLVASRPALRPSHLRPDKTSPLNQFHFSLFPSCTQTPPTTANAPSYSTATVDFGDSASSSDNDSDGLASSEPPSDSAARPAGTVPEAWLLQQAQQQQAQLQQGQPQDGTREHTGSPEEQGEGLGDDDEIDSGGGLSAAAASPHRDEPAGGAANRSSQPGHIPLPVWAASGGGEDNARGEAQQPAGLTPGQQQQQPPSPRQRPSSLPPPPPPPPRPPSSASSLASGVSLGGRCAPGPPAGPPPPRARPPSDAARRVMTGHLRSARRTASRMGRDLLLSVVCLAEHLGTSASLTSTGVLFRGVEGVTRWDNYAQFSAISFCLCALVQPEQPHGPTLRPRYCLFAAPAAAAHAATTPTVSPPTGMARHRSLVELHPALPRVELVFSQPWGARSALATVHVGAWGTLAFSPPLLCCRGEAVVFDFRCG